MLVKHYLKLRGSFVGFAVDPDFNNALDGLIVVDIRNMEGGSFCNTLENQGGENHFGKGKIGRCRNKVKEI